ncbi:MAG: YncE family protein [Tannerella sp.]|jgi:YVTN family beta-propeller protein|nr:YncE family protein [Tannerella sp.]
MKNWNIYSLAAASLLYAFAFTSCDGGNDPEPPVVEPDSSIIGFLNSGNFGSNDASLDFVYFTAGGEEVVSNLFFTKNGRNLGDTGNDMIACGSKLYIAVSGSKTVEVIGRDGASLKQLHFDGDPRYFAAHEGKVYVTLFDGHVARLDTATLAVEKTVPVGRNPEQIAVANNKLYVANSGGLDFASEIGYDRTVSIIDIPSFTETKKIEVGVNPSRIVTDSEGDVYVASMGNYADLPAVLQRIDREDRVSVVEGVVANEMVSTGERIYIISSQYDANWVATYAFISFDALQEKVISDHFIESGSEPANPYMICADPQTERLYISSSNYTSNGEFIEYNLEGKRLRQWALGLNPVKAVVVR